MNDRLCRARRLLTIQRQLERLTAWQMADLESQNLVLETKQRNLLCLLQEESKFTALFASAAMRRLQGLSEQLAEVDASKKRQRLRQLEERRRLRSAEHLVTALESLAQRETALLELNETIENNLWRALADR